MCNEKEIRLLKRQHTSLSIIINKFLNFLEKKIIVPTQNMEMSEVSTEEIFEITDSSINIENETVIESSKRRYSPDLDDSEVLSLKKFKEVSKNIFLLPT